MIWPSSVIFQMPPVFTTNNDCSIFSFSINNLRIDFIVHNWLDYIRRCRLTALLSVTTVTVEFLLKKQQKLFVVQVALFLCIKIEIFTTTVLLLLFWRCHQETKKKILIFFWYYGCMKRAKTFFDRSNCDLLNRLDPFKKTFLF